MASQSNLAEEVRRFLHRYIPSVSQLETLLLVAGQPERTWGIEEVSDELRSERTLIAEALSELRQNGLLKEIASSSEPCFRYAPDRVELRRQVELLATLYQERRHSVLGAIYERPEPQDPIRAFSDAFRLRDTQEKE